MFGMSAALVAAGGYHLSRQVELVVVKPVGNQTEDTFRQISRRVARLESLWQTAVEQEAKRLLNGSPEDKPAEVHGVVQISRLNPTFNDTARAHQRTDGGLVTIKPVLENQARHEPSEWILTEGASLSMNGWIEDGSDRLAWLAGDGRTAVVLLVDRDQAAMIAEKDVRARFEKLAIQSGEGLMTWEGPAGKPWAGNSPVAMGAADETLRHVSLFGDWTLRRNFPVREMVTYRLPVLVGTLGISSLLLVGGVLVSIWQSRATRRAELQVSFVNRVSHELRTPLTNLLLNTDLALDGLQNDDAKARRRLQLIREETSRLSRIVDNVQTFSRMRHGKPASPSPEACDIARVVNDVMENFSPLFARKSIRMSCDCRVNGVLPVDQDAFSQILSNLLSNIEKYAGEEACAKMTISIHAGRMIVEMSDNGPGIPAGAERRIFQPFERAGTKVNEGTTGTGLGLAISRDLAEDTGGSLVLVPSDKGARFRLEIPLRERSAS